MKRLIRQLLPVFVVNLVRDFKQKRKQIRLEKDKKAGLIYTKNDLISNFKQVGIESGDVLLVHASLSKIGYIENGAKDVVEALLSTVGNIGHVLMPNSPNSKFQLDYIQQLDVFDVKNAPSSLGAISEYFRSHPEAKRSAHPTEPVSCIGPNAGFFVDHHFGCLTPYDANSPFYKVAEAGGKILYLGVTLDNAGTNLHTLEDLVPDFKFPVYYHKPFEVKVRFENQKMEKMLTKVHNPQQSKKRKCDELIPLFESRGALKKVQIGQAASLLVDAKKMLDVMVEEYHLNGVTMYTPKGS